MKEIILKENNELQNSVLDYDNLIEKYINYIDVADNSLSTYKRALKQFSLYLEENGIKEPIREDILSYKEYLMSKNEPNTVNLYLVSVKSFFEWLEYENIKKNIAKNVKSLKMDRKHLKRSITPDEIKLVLEQCKDIREELLIKLMATCGLRENEVVNIQLKDFYNDNGSVMLNILGKGKTSKIDSVKIDNRVFELIKKYCKEYDITDYLFTSTSNHNKGGKLSTKTIRLIVTDLFKKAKLDMERLSTHSLRHFTATQSIKNGFSLLEVSEILRHSSVSTTQVYLDEINKSESKITNKLADMFY